MPMTQRALISRFLVSMVATWGMPGLLFAYFFATTRFPAPFTELSHLTWVTWSYATGMTVLSAVTLTMLLRRQLARLDMALPAAEKFLPIRQFAWAAAALVLIYVYGGALVVIWDAGIFAQGIRPPVWLLTAVVLVVVVYVALPGYIYNLNLFGRYFGPYAAHLKVVPSGTLVVATSVGIAFVSSTSLLVFEYVRFWQLSESTLWLWGVLIGYASAIAYLAWRSQNSGLQPLRTLLFSIDRISPDEVHALQPQSLDDLGVLTTVLKEQLINNDSIQRELRESQARLQMFAEAASDYLFELDEDLNFSYLSPKFEELTGFPVSSVIGISALSMGTEHYLNSDQAKHAEDLRNHRPYRNYRFSVQTADQQLMYLEVSATPYFDDQGRFEGYRGAGSNVTDIVEAQQRLIYKEAELAQAQKMEAVGQLTGGIAHDFNNLLTSIMGNLELAQLTPAQPSRLVAHIDAAHDSARRGAALVQRLLAFSRRQSLHPQTIDVPTLLSHMQDLMQRTLGENIQIHLRSPERTWPCMVDPNQLESAVLNGAINARDAMTGGGTLTIEIDNHTRLDEAMDESTARDYVRIRMTDTGCGIDADILPHVFEPFFTTKQAGEGSGLGLSMVYGFVHQSGGQVHIFSEPGTGTTLEFLLPRAETPVLSDTMESPTPGHSLGGGGRSILLLEDDSAVSSVVQEALLSRGYQVVTVTTGQAAIDAARRLEHLDLLLTDVVLPGEMSGVDVARAISELRPGTRVLFISGYTRDELLRKDGLGMDIELLPKPFRLNELAHRVAQVLGENT